MEWTRGTEITLDFGTIFHFLFGFLGGVLDASYLFAGIFLFKQFWDFKEGEEWAETSGDIAEFSSGLVAGLIMKRFLLPATITPSVV